MLKNTARRLGEEYIHETDARWGNLVEYFSKSLLFFCKIQGA
jgi:hypothetical protein